MRFLGVWSWSAWGINVTNNVFSKSAVKPWTSTAGCSAPRRQHGCAASGHIYMTALLACFHQECVVWFGVRQARYKGGVNLIWHRTPEHHLKWPVDSRN